MAHILGKIIPKPRQNHAKTTLITIGMTTLVLGVAKPRRQLSHCFVHISVAMALSYIVIMTLLEGME